jgi:hypothetical protein
MAAIDASVMRRTVPVNGQHRDAMTTLGGTLALQERKIQQRLTRAEPDTTAWRTSPWATPTPGCRGLSDARLTEVASTPPAAV